MWKKKPGLEKREYAKKKTSHETDLRAGCTQPEETGSDPPTVVQVSLKGSKSRGEEPEGRCPESQGDSPLQQERDQRSDSAQTESLAKKAPKSELVNKIPCRKAEVGTNTSSREKGPAVPEKSKKKRPWDSQKNKRSTQALPKGGKKRGKGGKTYRQLRGKPENPSAIPRNGLNTC